MAGAAVVLAGAGGEVASGNAAIDTPNGSGTGDLLVAAITYRGSAAFTAPAGWVKDVEENSGNTTEETTGSISSLMIAHRELSGAAAGSYTFTRAGGGVACFRMYTVRGHKIGDVIDVLTSLTNAAASTTMGPAGSVSTTQVNDLVMAFAAGARNGEIGPFNFGGTPIPAFDWFGSTTGANVDFGHARATKLSASAIGTISATNAASARHSVGAIAVKSALSVTIAPNPASATGAVGQPNPLRGSLIAEPSAAIAKGSVVNPTVMQSSSIAAPAPASARGDVVPPQVVFLSTSVTPSPASAVGSRVNPTVKGELIITPAPASAKGSTFFDDVEIGFGPLFSSQNPISNVWTPQVALP